MELVGRVTQTFPVDAFLINHKKNVTAIGHLHNGG
jgi:hypothetical protein